MVVVKANLSCATLNDVVVVAAAVLEKEWAAMGVVEAEVVATKIEEHVAYCCFYF